MNAPRSMVLFANYAVGLKTGFTFQASMFGAIFGYGIIKLFSKSKLPIIGGSFGPQENSIIQAAATGSGGIAGSSIPSMRSLRCMP